MHSVKRTTLHFTGPGCVELREGPLPVPSPGEVLVQTQLSGISAGTEMLVYRGQFPYDALEALDFVSTELKYPLAYGYACVGKVVEIGKAVEPEWQDRNVFSFQPHTSHFVASPDVLLPVPGDLPFAEAVFLPNMETAVNLVQDAAPILGERVLVLGQGTVGLLTAALLREFPLTCLVTADRYERRRAASRDLGVTAALDPSVEEFHMLAKDQVGVVGSGFDASFEITGNPPALDDAIALTRFSGRILVASWYGMKSVSLDMGTSYHRSRIKLIASQVSSISPELSGRWNKSRRFEVAWAALRRIQPSKWITHQVPLDRAPSMYELLDKSPEQALQIVFDYSH